MMIFRSTAWFLPRVRYIVWCMMILGNVMWVETLNPIDFPFLRTGTGIKENIRFAWVYVLFSRFMHSLIVNL